MPSRAEATEQFAQAVREALGGYSTHQASIKTGISQAYIHRMKNGGIPSETILERFASGMCADLKALRVAAGYEQPSDPIEAVELTLRANTELSETAKRQILDFVRKVVDSEPRYPE